MQNPQPPFDGTTERVEQLKKLVRDQLRSDDLSGQLRRTLEGLLAEGKITPDSNEQEIVRALQQRGTIEGVVRLMARTKLAASGSGTAASAASKKIEIPGGARPGQHYLSVRLLRGKAFLVSGAALPAEAGFEAPSLVMDIQFQDKRVQSNPVVWCAEPPFSDSFVFEIARSKNRLVSDASTTLPLGKLNCPLHLVVMRQFADGSTEFVGTATIEWRKVLRGGGLTVSAELMGPARVAVGVIDARLEVLPPCDADLQWSDEELALQIQSEKAQRAEALQLFTLEAKQWWAEYRRVSDDCASRPLKLLAANEAGEEVPCCSFVWPLRAPRVVRSPAEAARFVSLLPLTREESIGAAADVWSTAHTVLARGRGGVEDHAVLLCSLLLGFGLDAYVCLGATDAGGHCWVVVRGGTASATAATMWEATTAARYAYPGGAEKRRGPQYVAVDCAFNHAAVYGNVQPLGAAPVSFDFDDPRLWKAFPGNVIANLPRAWSAPPVQKSGMDAEQVSQGVEMALRDLVAQHRQSVGLVTVWDEDLCHRLSAALWSYEMERLAGFPVCPTDFEQSIRRAVPDGFTFKGFPISFSHRNPMKMLTALLKSAVGADVLRTRGDKVRLALSVQCHPYAESAVASWVMIAVRYVSV